MKALTLTQPWATLVAIGAKQFETRSWQTTYRGPLAIHAAAGLDPVGGIDGLRGMCAAEPFRTALNDARITADELPRGAIVAVVYLALIYRVTNERLDHPEPRTMGHRPGALPSEPERSFGNYADGRFVWQLTNVRQLAVPMPCRGMQGLWTVPDRVAGFVALG